MDDIRVLLADDHVMVREGLAAILRDCDGIDVVGQADGGRTAVEMCMEQKPDVLVVDYSMPDMDGISVTTTLSQQGSQSKVLFLTMHENLHYVMKAMSAGASGFVIKSGDTSELVDAIRNVHQGVSYISRAFDEQVHRQLAKPSGQRNGVEKLSQREFQLLRHLGEGLTLQETARTMQVSESTASTYRTRLMNKLNLQNTAQIIRYAIENQIVG